MSSRDPKPEVLRLEELALQVKAGDIKLPKFQRPFVWKKSDMLLLLDSIYKGYPIGSLLLWNSTQKLKSVRDIADLTVDDQITAYPTSYLLDGQQRLTTLCGALFWKGGAVDSLWNILFDLDREIFVHGKNSSIETCFPLNKLIDTGDFIAQCMRFQHLVDRDRYTSNAQKLLRSIKDYKIAVVKIGDMSIEEVAPIFERINSTGRKLTMVDLMMAATWSNGFDLASRIEDIGRECDRAGLSGVADQYILRSFAAAAGFGVNKEDIQKLRALAPSELIHGADSCKLALSRAASWISSSLGIQDSAFLPYSLFLTHAVEFFRIANCPTDHQLLELRRWFWYTAITAYFAGASTGQNNKDIKLVRDFAAGKVDHLYERGTINITKLLFDKFNLKNASSTTFSLALLSVHPKKSISGRDLDIGVLIEKGGRLYHGIFDGGAGDRNIGFAINPFREWATSAAQDAEVLAQHLLNSDAIQCAKAGDFEGFVQHRAKMVAQYFKNETDCEIVFSIQANDGWIGDTEELERDDDDR